MRIKLTEVGAVEKEKQYFIIPIKYTDDKGQTRDKKIYSFNNASYKALKGAEAGQEFDVKLEQKNGFWNWVEVNPANGAAPQASGDFQSRKSSFETPEERALKNTRITRMSCLAQAVAFSGVGEHNVENVLEIAEQFEGWVNRE
jgi:hypothetical protein